MKNFYTLVLICCLGSSYAQHVKKPQIGIAQDFEKDSLLYAAGYTCMVESISKCISPLKISDETFEQNVKAFKKLKVPIYAVNIFMPGELKLVGPEVNEAKIVEYAKKVYQRCNTAGVDLIIWGSGGARRVPEGFDQGKAKEQFISIARKLATVAKEYKITLALENLNSTETNFITTAKEALDVVQKVDHPNFRLCVDVYHMLMEGEAPDIIAKTKRYLVHCDIAERENRASPGVKGDDFRPYLKELRKVGYDKKIILECRWTNLEQEAFTGLMNLRRQLDEVYDN